MIDTLCIRIPFLHSGIPSDRILRIDQQGEISWQVIANRQIEGTWSSSAFVRSQNQINETEFTHLRIECSPKFIQGHNTYGTENIQALIAAIAKKVTEKLQPELPALAGLPFRAANLAEIEVIRIDINRTYELPTQADVTNWLRSALYTSHTRSGRPTLKGSTLYFNKTSRRWSFKFYSKFQEITETKQKLPPEIRERLLKHLENKLRAELTLRKKELTDLDLLTADKFTPETINNLYAEYMGKIQMTQKLSLTHKEFFDLPAKLKKTYQLWQAGVDVQLAMSKATFYRHRSELQAYGIDISQPFASNKTNIIPLVRYLEAEPVKTPDWLIKAGHVIAA